MKKYRITVVCLDTTTFTHTVYSNSKKEATYFCDGACAAYKKMGKEIFISRVELKK